jgi:hypothetical protein
MIQGRCSLSFAPETLQSLAVSGYVFRKEFKSNKTVETGVFGLVDHTHPAAAELFQDAVVRDDLP